MMHFNKAIPAVFEPYLADSEIQDRSFSEEAEVYYINKDRGYYLKHAEGLEREYRNAVGMHRLGFGPKPVLFEDGWMLTEKAEGESCISPRYLEDPDRLCHVMADILRQVHASSSVGFSAIRDSYIQNVYAGHAQGNNSLDLCPEWFQISSLEEAFEIFERGKHLLREETVVHGDYCLPNILLKDWEFSALIDFDHAGVFDRHIDLYWAVWTLQRNLHTEAYTKTFLDAYGDYDPEVLRVIAAAEVFG